MKLSRRRMKVSRRRMKVSRTRIQILVLKTLKRITFYVENSGKTIKSFVFHIRILYSLESLEDKNETLEEKNETLEEKNESLEEKNTNSCHRDFKENNILMWKTKKRR